MLNINTSNNNMAISFFNYSYDRFSQSMDENRENNIHYEQFKQNLRESNLTTLLYMKEKWS
jgi:hypothetical protein